MVRVPPCSISSRRQEEREGEGRRYRKGESEVEGKEREEKREGVKGMRMEGLGKWDRTKRENCNKGREDKEGGRTGLGRN